MNRQEYNLDRLAVAARRVVALLDNRQPGLWTWNTALKEAITLLEAEVQPGDPEPPTHTAADLVQSP